MRSNEVILTFREQMLKRGEFKVSTINLKLTHICGFVAMCADRGLVTWRPSRRYKLKGAKDPMRKGRLTFDDMERICRFVFGRKEHDGRRFHANFTVRRDKAICALLCLHALRDFQVRGITSKDVEVGGKEVWIFDKGRAEKSLLRLHDVASDFLNSYLTLHEAHRVEDDAPLFVGGRGVKIEWGKPLTPRGLYHVIRRWAKDAVKEEMKGATWEEIIKGQARYNGITTHDFRKAVVTYIVDTQGAEVAQRTARHDNINTTLARYDNKHQDRAMQGSDAVAQKIQ